MSQVSDNQIGRQVAGYRLTAVLGVGGMAKVYRAQDLRLGREVAVKLLSGEKVGDEDFVRRFRNEARRVAALTHPNIVPVYQYGEDQGALFLVMPIMAESLRQRLEREPVLPLAEAVRVVVQIAAALQEAHAQGLVHRDVKPENILLDAAGVAYLTDFGIAREENVLRQSGAKRTLSATGLPVGTPEYMAPEQLQAAIVDHRADIYALGSVLYELVTGTTPHAAATPYAVAVRVLTEPLTPPTAHNPRIPPQVEEVIERALALRPEDRYQNVSSFAEALTAAAGASAAAGGAAALRSARPRPQGSPRAPRTSPTGPSGRLRSLGRLGRLWRPTGGGVPAGLSSYRWILVAALVVLLLLCGTGILLTHQPGLASQGIVLATATSSPTGYTTPAPPVGTNVPSPQRTATAQASRTPGARRTPTTGPGTPTPTTGPGTPTPTATATPAPTATATPAPTATPTPMELELSPSGQIFLSKQGQTCTGEQSITNVNAFPVMWEWTDVSPPVNNLQFMTSGSGWTSGFPSGTLPGNSSTTLSFSFDNCSGGEFNTVSMMDDQGNFYSFNLQL